MNDDYVLEERGYSRHQRPIITSEPGILDGHTHTSDLALQVDEATIQTCKSGVKKSLLFSQKASFKTAWQSNRLLSSSTREDSHYAIGSARELVFSSKLQRVML